MTTTKKQTPSNSKPRAKPEPLEKPGQHGPQRRPQATTSLTRLCRLLTLSTDVSLTTILREAADEIEALRREQPPSDELDDERSV